MKSNNIISCIVLSIAFGFLAGGLFINNYLETTSYYVKAWYFDLPVIVIFTIIGSFLSFKLFNRFIL